MSKLDLIMMAVGNLWRRKLRTFLTILGVMIGTSSIVVMLSLGFGMSKSVEDQVSSWGSLTNIQVHEAMGGQAIDQKGSPKAGKLNKQTVQDFKGLKHVKAVNATISASGQLKAGRYLTWASLVGVDPDIMEDFDFKLEEGRLLNPSDKLSIVVGGNVASSFYNPKSQIYQEIDLNLLTEKLSLTLDDDGGMRDNKKQKEYGVKAVGILSPDDFETSYNIYMPIQELEKLIAANKKSSPQQGQQKDRTGKNEFNSITVKVDEMDNVMEVQDNIKALGFEAYSLTEELKSFKQQSMMIQAVLGGIGAISLLVAAIGITNTMIMSIYERTKEIGIMKVIGASIQDIKKLFLVESGFIGFFGGLIGLIFSYLISFILNRFGAGFLESMGFSSESGISIIPLYLSLGAMGFSILIGLIAGYFPAKRAMNLSALEAIRTE